MQAAQEDLSGEAREKSTSAGVLILFSGIVMGLIFMRFHLIVPVQIYGVLRILLAALWYPAPGERRVAEPSQRDSASDR